MTSKENTNLKQFLKFGDIQKIVDISGVSYATVNLWLQDEDYRAEISEPHGTCITNAYAIVIEEKEIIRQKNLNKINSINHE